MYIHSVYTVYKVTIVNSDPANDVDIDIATTRYTFAEKIYHSCVTSKNKKTVSERIDSVVLNKFLGLPIFLGVMYLMFMFAIHVGSAFIDFFDNFGIDSG